LDPFDALWGEIEPLGPAEALPLLAPNWVGFFTYEAGRFAERLPTPAPDPLQLPTSWWARYPAFVVGPEPDGGVTVVGQSIGDVEALWERVVRSAPAPFGGSTASAPVVASCDEAEYRRRVQRVLGYLAAGDLYQANLAVRFEVQTPKGFDPAALFARFCAERPVPYAAYLDCGDFAVVSVSPECLVRWQSSGAAESLPIKGTAARHPDPRVDSALAGELLSRAKDAAEHVMIVDLVRNDLGRSALPGSVRVDSIASLDSHPGVHHLTSLVRAQLEPHRGIAELVRGLFPGGSVTGAPKVRACEVIAELEAEQRGLYCGALGYVGLDGGGALNLPIRTAVWRAGKLTFHAGCGIVADSDPASEYAEMRLKAEGWTSLLSRGL
jgi:para-aminobenzoate synthetase component 1